MLIWPYLLHDLPAELSGGRTCRVVYRVIAATSFAFLLDGGTVEDQALAEDWGPLQTIYPFYPVICLLRWRTEARFSR